LSVLVFWCFSVFEGPAQAISKRLGNDLKNTKTQKHQNPKTQKHTYLFDDAGQCRPKGWHCPFL
jgi:hypothetical protein